MAHQGRLAVVLGGAGFLGSHLTGELLRRGRAVRVFDRPNADLANLETAASGWDFLGGDFLNESDQEAAVAGADIVYHLISTTIPATSNRNPVYDVETNLVATLKLLDHARAAGVRRVVFVSSGGTVYGRPEMLPIAEDHPARPEVSYGIVKLAVEQYLRVHHHVHGLGSAVVRLANPYGPNQDPEGAQGAASVFLGHALADRPVTIWGDGSVVRDYVYVTDAVRGIAAAGEDGPDGRTFNIGSGRGVSLLELIAAIREVSGREVPVRHEPSRPFDVPVNVLDIARARAELGWEPRTSLRDGLRATWTWLMRGGSAGGANA